MKQKQMKYCRLNNFRSSIVLPMFADIILRNVLVIAVMMSTKIIVNVRAFKR